MVPLRRGLSRFSRHAGSAWGPHGQRRRGPLHLFNEVQVRQRGVVRAGLQSANTQAMQGKGGGEPNGRGIDGGRFGGRLHAWHCERRMQVQWCTDNQTYMGRPVVPAPLRNHCLRFSCCHGMCDVWVCRQCCAPRLLPLYLHTCAATAAAACTVDLNDLALMCVDTALRMSQRHRSSHLPSLRSLSRFYICSEQAVIRPSRSGMQERAPSRQSSGRRACRQQGRRGTSTLPQVL